MGDHATIKEVFNQCQTGLQGHGKLIKTLHKVYDKTEFPSFWSEFSHFLKYSLIVFKREPAVERTIDFVANFVTSLCKKTSEKGDDTADDDSQEEEEDSIENNQLLQEMFDFLLNLHSVKERAVRFRCCQLVNKLLTNLGEDAQIDDDLYDRLYECMLERLKDKCPVVRYHAVMAMARLQNPSDENCPVIKAFLFLLNCDPNPDVRRAVLSAIAPSAKTLASIIDRTRDVKDTVRKTAYEVLADKVHIRAMSIALRLQLMSEGLKDRAEGVKAACSGKLLQAWMRILNGSTMELLKCLDVEDSTDVCSNVLETLFKATTVPELIEKFDILNEQLLVPEDSLTSESALYWQVVCKFIHSLGTDNEEYLDKVLPTTVDFCAYMQRYIDAMKTVDDPEILLGWEFIIEQLLLITSYMDMADAASKRALETLLHNMLMTDHVSHRLVKPVIDRICGVRGTGENLIAYFAETVSEIRVPITVVEKDVEAEQKRQINLKIAGIRVQLNQLRDDLETAVKQQNFEQAGEIKKAIAQLDSEKNQLLETNEPVREEIRTEKNDPFTLLKCQTIISEMLQALKLNSVSDTLQTMIENEILPGIQNEDTDVRNMAMQALGLCCYHSKDLLFTYIPLFMQASQIDVEVVRVTACQVLFDLLLLFGLEIIDASESSADSDDPLDSDTLDSTTSDATSQSGDKRSGTASKLVAIICSFLDGESSELRTCAAEGLCKLLVTGRLVSSKILSHLILLWYNPLSEDDTHLRDCLGTFFPLYALASRSNQQIVEESFLPTLRTLLNAPASSPLAEVDANNVAELLVQLTNSKLLTNNETTMDNPGHDNLSETICNEILSEPESKHLKLWVRILNQMEVSPDNEVVLKDLRVLAYKMVKVVKEKISLKGLQKFQDRINKLAEKYITENDDIENMITEQEETEPAEEENIQDTTAQTPKRKRIRGLYSQNMTLAMDSETEVDLVADPMEEVDASALMSRSTSEAAPPRWRKNTTSTTEIADDTAVAQDTTSSEPASVSTAGDDKDPAGNADTEDSDAGISQESADNTTNNVDDESNEKSKSPVRTGRSPGKKTSSPKKGEKRSPVKSADKRKASKSPNTPPTKRVASESPMRKSQEKRKASKSPSRERKRMSKSPSTSNARKASKSPDKRTSGSPLRERSSSRSPVKSNERKSSPQRKSTSKSPVKSPDVKKSDKVAAEKNKSPGNKTTKSSKESDPKLVSGKPNIRNAGSSNTRVARQAVSKIDSGLRKNTKTAGSKVTGPTVKSPSQRQDKTDNKNTTAAKSKTNEIASASKTSGARSSPRTGRTAAEPIVADTPDAVLRRSSARSATPRNSPRSQASDTSVPDTPEDPKTRTASSKQVKSAQRTTTRTAGKSTPDVSSSGLRSNRLRGTPNNASPTVVRKTTKRTAAVSSTSSASDSSPEKPASKTSRSARGKVVNSARSVPGSASSTRSNRSKPASSNSTKSPVKNLSKELNVSDDDDDGETLRRRAKPSRRSNTAPSSTLKSPAVTGRASTALNTPPTAGRATRAALNTPPTTGRATRSTLSQSSVESPTVDTPASQRASRNRKVVTDSSQESLSLISSKGSPASSVRSQSSAGSKRTAASRSQSTSNSVSSKAVKPGDSKVARSAVATRPSRNQPSQPKRPSRLASRSSDRK